MDSETVMLAGMAVVVLLLGLAAWVYTSRRRHVHRRERFGPEYERTVEAVGPARADSVLRSARGRGEIVETEDRGNSNWLILLNVNGGVDGTRSASRRTKSVAG
jgi:hypothetical protein